MKTFTNIVAKVLLVCMLVSTQAPLAHATHPHDLLLQDLHDFLRSIDKGKNYTNIWGEDDKIKLITSSYDADGKLVKSYIKPNTPTAKFIEIWGPEHGPTVKLKMTSIMTVAPKGWYAALVKSSGFMVILLIASWATGHEIPDPSVPIHNLWLRDARLTTLWFVKQEIIDARNLSFQALKLYSGQYRKAKEQYRELITKYDDLDEQVLAALVNVQTQGDFEKEMKKPENIKLHAEWLMTQKTLASTSDIINDLLKKIQREALLLKKWNWYLENKSIYHTIVDDL